MRTPCCGFDVGGAVSVATAVVVCVTKCVHDDCECVYIVFGYVYVFQVDSKMSP